MLVAIRSSIYVHEFKDFLSLYIFMNNIGDICTKITGFKLRCALKINNGGLPPALQGGNSGIPDVSYHGVSSQKCGAFNTHVCM